MATSTFSQNFAIGQDYFYITRVTTVGGNAVAQIGRWNGGADTIEPVASGLNGLGLAIAIGPDPNSIFVGGSFTASVTGVTTNKIAYFDGNAWNGLGTPPFNNDVTNLAYDAENNLLYAVSHDTSTTDNRLSVWNGSTWTGISDSFTINNYPKLALDSDNNLYLGYGSTLRRYLKATSTWELISSSAGTTIIDMKYNSTTNRVYYALNTSSNNVKYYDVAGGTITTLTSVAGSVYAIAFDSSDNLYASCWPSSGYLASVVRYDAGSWTNLYNHQSTSGVLELEIDDNGNIFAKPNSGTLVIGVSPYTNGNWQEFSASTTISYAGPSEGNFISAVGTANGLATALGVGEAIIPSDFIWGTPKKLCSNLPVKIAVAGEMNQEKMYLLSAGHLWEKPT